MVRKVAIAYTIFSVLALLGLIAWLASSFYRLTADNLLNAANTFQAVRTSVADSLAKGGNLDAPGFRAYVRSLFLADPLIEVLSVTASPGGVQYIFARHESDLGSPRVAGNEWKGAIHYNRTTQRFFSSSLTGPAARPQLTIQALFNIVRREEIYALARITLIVLISFVILTGIVILLLPFFGSRLRARRPEAPASGSEGSLPEEEARASAAAEERIRRPKAEAPTSAGAVPDEGMPARAEAARAASREPAPPVEATPPPEEGALSAGTQATLPEEPPPSPTRAPAGASTPAPGARSRAPRTAAPPAAEAEADDQLPPGIELPSLEEVAGEAHAGRGALNEMELFEELAEPDEGDLAPLLPPKSSGSPGRPQTAPRPARPDAGAAGGHATLAPPGAPFEVTEIDEPLAPPAAAQRARFGIEELADISDFEDLEEIDGHGAPEPAPARRRLAGQQAMPPAEVEAPAPPERAELKVSEVEELQLAEPYQAAEAGTQGEPPREREEKAGSSAARPAAVPPPAAPERRARATPEGAEARRQLFNPETGLAWEDHLGQRLSFELDRAAAFDQDLSLAVIRFAQPEQGVDRLNYARDIRTSFPFHDLCFERGRGGFALVLPNTDIDQAIRAMENFQKKVAEDRPSAPQMVFGLSARNGRLLSAARLLAEAESAVRRAGEDRRNSIYALRVDPGMYREFIKSTLK